MQKKQKKLLRAEILIILVSFALIFLNGYSLVSAFEMSSDNYRLQSTSINVGGREEQTSANYKLSETIGEISTGDSTSSNYKLKAGYRQMQEVYISVSSPDDTTMSPSIPGITGNPGNPSSGELSWNVKTDNPAGFNMKIHASTDPALQLDASNYFSDYTPESAGVPDYNWNSPSAGEAEFGFTVEPETAEDTVQKFLDNGSDACNIENGSQTPDKCWLDFDGTTDIDIINRHSRTDSTGEDEVVKFRAESNGKFLEEGNYTATITVTVTAN